MLLPAARAAPWLATVASEPGQRRQPPGPARARGQRQPVPTAHPNPLRAPSTRTHGHFFKPQSSPIPGGFVRQHGPCLTSLKINNLQLFRRNIWLIFSLHVTVIRTDPLLTINLL